MILNIYNKKKLYNLSQNQLECDDYERKMLKRRQECDS